MVRVAKKLVYFTVYSQKNDLMHNSEYVLYTWN